MRGIEDVVAMVTGNGSERIKVIIRSQQDIMPVWPTKRMPKRRGIGGDSRAWQLAQHPAARHRLQDEVNSPTTQPGRIRHDVFHYFYHHDLKPGHQKKVYHIIIFNPQG